MGNLRDSMTEEEWKDLGKSADNINHPNHYGGASNPYEAIKVIDAWELDFCLGNVIKYIARAGKKGEWKHLEDLKKAQWYLNHAIETYNNGNK